MSAKLDSLEFELAVDCHRFDIGTTSLLTQAGVATGAMAAATRRPQHIRAQERGPVSTNTAPWFASGDSHRADSVSQAPARSASGSAAPAAARSPTGNSTAQTPGGWASRRRLTAP